VFRTDRLLRPSAYRGVVRAGMADQALIFSGRGWFDSPLVNEWLPTPSAFHQVHLAVLND